MRTLVFFIALFWLNLQVWCQPTLISSEALPLPGDTVFYFRDELPNRIVITPPGEDQFWNYGSLLAPVLKYKIISKSEEGVELFSSDGTPDQLKGQDDGLHWITAKSLKIGSKVIEGNWISGKGLPLPTWKLEYDDQLETESIFEASMSRRVLPSEWQSAIPGTIDSIKISVFYERMLHNDASGTIMLTGGLREEVARIHMQDHISKKLWAFSNGEWEDITNLLRLADLDPEQEESYHFVSLATGGDICAVYLDQLQKPEYVNFHVPNEQAGYYPRSLNTQWLHAYPNPALAIVRFKFLDIPPGNYTVRFYDILMRKIFEKKYNLQGDETVEININHLERGTYLYSLEDQGRNKKITKRLIVIKP